jgi:hypothetical protein
VALCAWRLTNYPASLIGLDWPMDAFGYEFIRMVIAGWMASNVFNIMLNVAEVLPAWRRPGPLRPVPRTGWQPLPLRGRRVTTQQIIEIEGDGIAADDLLAGLRPAIDRLGPAHIPGLMEDGGAVPQIPLVRDRDGNFVPAQRPDSEAVRVRR